MMELQQSQKQTQVLTPQMVQAVKILQMGVPELQEYVAETIQENPVLELPEPSDAPAPDDNMARKLEWLKNTDRQNAWYHAQDAEDERGDWLSRQGYFVDEDRDLKRYLLSQFMGIDLDGQIMDAVEFLIGRLDDNGFLEESIASLAALSGIDLAVMTRALIELQAAEPVGVGAQTLTECLKLQLLRMSGDHRLAIRIVEGHLDDLARRRYNVIAKDLGASRQEVEAACALIRGLDPKPASGFSGQEDPVYITPDVIVNALPGGFEVVVNDYTMPKLKISPYYAELMRTSDDKEVRGYLSEKAAQARWVMRAIDQRHSTLLRCAQQIVERQEGFFRSGAAHLAPLTMGEVAQAMSVHESTVSRAVRDKYLQCGWGTYPMSYFFCRDLGGQAMEDGVSPNAAKALLKKLIDGEDKAHPLSDQKLCQRMGEQGCPIARRTVAKYREELGLPGAAGRREREG